MWKGKVAQETSSEDGEQEGAVEAEAENSAENMAEAMRRSELGYCRPGVTDFRRLRTPVSFVILFLNPWCRSRSRQHEEVEEATVAWASRAFHD